MSDRAEDTQQIPPVSGNTKIQLVGSDAFRAISATMAEGATRQMEIFTYDLDPRIYDQQPFLEATKHLAIHTRGLAVKILLHDNDLVQRQGHRLIELARRMPSGIEIRKTHPDFVDHPETFLVVDRSRYVKASLSARYHGVADCLGKRQARRLGEFFNLVWECSENDSDLRHLHI
ncbi:MAG: hypothetical protein KDI63_14690 [Gammaproteobacteria bacterium]|nr:hypothetical protein [Gammaproteobacteria bacterium]